MRRWLLIVVGVAAYVTALIAFTPAALVDAGFERATGGRVRLTSPGGSLWAGRGQLELRDPQAPGALVRTVEWRLRPQTLLDGRLGFDVRTRGAEGPFSAIFSWRRFELASLRVSLPAGALGVALPQLAPLELTGNVSLSVPSIVWENGELNGNAAVRLSSAGTALSAISPLGSYELKLDCSRSIARMALSTVEGALDLTGSGVWTMGQRPHLRASARVPPSHRPQLAPLLGLVGVEREPGRFELELK